MSIFGCSNLRFSDSGFSSRGRISRTNAFAPTQSVWRFRDASRPMINGRRACAVVVRFSSSVLYISSGHTSCLLQCPSNRAVHRVCIFRHCSYQVVPHNIYLAMYSPASVNVLAFDPEPCDNGTKHMSNQADANKKNNDNRTRACVEPRSRSSQGLCGEVPIGSCLLGVLLYAGHMWVYAICALH